MSSADLAIRLRRAAFNQALATHDLHAIGSLLAPNVVLVTGTDSAVITGRKAQLQTWKQEFARPVPTRYIRTPDSIIPSSVEPIAFEHGHWIGADAVTSRALASGSYTAKWRMIISDWIIEAEIYLTLA